MTFQFDMISKCSLLLTDIDGREVEVPLASGLVFDGDGVHGMRLPLRGIVMYAAPEKAEQARHSLAGPWIAELKIAGEGES